MAPWTNAVVATWVVFVPAVAVGAAGVPVNVGDASGAAEMSDAARPVPVTSAFDSVTAPVRVLNDATPPTTAASNITTSTFTPDRTALTEPSGSRTTSAV